MATLVLSGRWPFRLSREEARPWLLEELRSVTDLPEVKNATFRVAKRACDRWSPAADWMLDLEIEDDQDQARLLSRPACVELLQDFRRLRMEPGLAAVEVAARIVSESPT